MKAKTALLITVAVLTTRNSWAFPVYIPPGNVVQNGNFQFFLADWSGHTQGGLGNWRSVPNDYAVLAVDIYQDLDTRAGQQYSLSFYAAADLYWGPSVTATVALNNAALASLTTPPYAYNPQVNRYDQMHWEQLTFTFTASSDTTRLEFIDNNTYDFGLAAVSVVAVPEPTSLAFVLLGGIALMIERERRS